MLVSARTPTDLLESCHTEVSKHRSPLTVMLAAEGATNHSQGEDKTLALREYFCEV